MTTYYVRQSVGNDSSAGTSAATAWATIGKALGASGMASGDTVYIGAGIYREQITVNFTPSIATNVIGDVDGAQTGDAGEVRISVFTAGDVFLNASATALNCNSKPFLAFSNLVVHATGNAVTNVVHDTSFTRCAIFTSGSTSSIGITATVDTANNIIIDQCRLMNGGAATNVAITLPTSAIADYDAAIYVRNTMLLNGSSGSNAVAVSSSGANSSKGGGVHVRNCTLFGQFATSGASLSTTSPCTIYNSVVQTGGGTSLNAGASGQIVEDYNVLVSSAARTNVTAGTHSHGAGIGECFLPSFGQETIWGGTPRPFGMPAVNMQSVLGFGQAAAAGSDTQPTVDILNRQRPGGVGQQVASGTATSGTATTLTNANATLGTNGLAGATVNITGGTGSGQYKTIKSHTPTVVTVYGNWVTTPDSTSTYTIYWGAQAEHFQCTSGSTTTAVQSSASWTTNMWTGYTVNVVSGTGNGQTTTVTSNTGTTLTVPTLSTGLDSTSVVKLYRQTSETTVNTSAGAFERHDSGKKEVTLTDAGGVAVALFGWTDQDIFVPVDTSSTTITVKCSFDTDHGNTNKPQATIVADAEIGVTASTQTCTGTAGSGTFETLTFPAQTATARGVVRVRLQSRSDKPTGRAVFDTISVT